MKHRMQSTIEVLILCAGVMTLFAAPGPWKPRAEDYFAECANATYEHPAKVPDATGKEYIARDQYDCCTSVCSYYSRITGESYANCVAACERYTP